MRESQRVTKHVGQLLVGRRGLLVSPFRKPPPDDIPQALAQEFRHRAASRVLDKSVKVIGGVGRGGHDLQHCRATP
ncbi:MAG: hypothetical protein QGG73_13515 [Candidatus Hydrogenedentes bacterium]|nr:hypothetical protein [Candidatus Hydrogenedentota bacterium]